LAHPHYILLIHSMLWEIGANMELAMLPRRKTCADRIKHPDAGTEAVPLNPLSAIAPLFRVRPEIQDVCRFALQWEVVHEAEPTGFAQFHIVTNGSCLLERYCGETFKLEAGSILLLPQGDSHVVRSASRGGSSGAPIRTEYNNAIRIKTNTRDASDTELICGRLRFEGAMYSLVIAALPKAIVLSIGRTDLFDRMRMLVQAIDEELQAARPGAADDRHRARHRSLRDDASHAFRTVRVIERHNTAARIVVFGQSRHRHVESSRASMDAGRACGGSACFARDPGSDLPQGGRSSAARLPERVAARSGTPAPQFDECNPGAGGGSGRLRL